jgi:hypothetical protein
VKAPLPQPTSIHFRPEGAASQLNAVSTGYFAEAAAARLITSRVALMTRSG